MSAIHKVICDSCGANITYTDNCVDFRLALFSEGKPIKPGLNSVTAMNIEPEIPNEMHFCDLRCLEDWMHKRKAKA